VSFPVPPAMMQGGPPVQPPEMPTLSSTPVAPGANQPVMPEPGQVGAIPRLFFNVEQQLTLIAKVVPENLVEDLDAISQQLRAVMIKTIQSGAGASVQPIGLQPAGQPNPNVGGFGPSLGADTGIS
jgi:hypothetical protein